MNKKKTKFLLSGSLHSTEEGNSKEILNKIPNISVGYKYSEQR